MVNRPVREKERGRLAWPLASRATRATAVLPTKKVTVPVGVPAPAGPLTVAVNVTVCLTLAGLADDARAVVGAACVGVAAGALTCSVSACELLPTKLPSPL